MLSPPNFAERRRVLRYVRKLIEDSTGERKEKARDIEQQLVALLDSEPNQQDTTRAIEFLDDVLEKLPD